jgi:hypothetical protein
MEKKMINIHMLKVKKEHPQINMHSHIHKVTHSQEVLQVDSLQDSHQWEE